MAAEPGEFEIRVVGDCPSDISHFSIPQTVGGAGDTEVCQVNRLDGTTAPAGKEDPEGSLNARRPTHTAPREGMPGHNSGTAHSEPAPQLCPITVAGEPTAPDANAAGEPTAPDAAAGEPTAPDAAAGEPTAPDAAGEPTAPDATTGEPTAPDAAGEPTAPDANAAGEPTAPGANAGEPTAPDPARIGSYHAATDSCISAPTIQESHLPPWSRRQVKCDRGFKRCW